MLNCPAERTKRHSPSILYLYRTSVLSAMEWLLTHETDDDIDTPVRLLDDLHVSHRDKSEVSFIV